MSSVQTWDPALYARNARFVSDPGSGVLKLLAPQPGERILDLGCGDGVLTKKLVAVDSSAPQIEAARKLGLDAHVMEGEALPFRNEFDAVFSAKRGYCDDLAAWPGTFREYEFWRNPYELNATGRLLIT